MKRRRDGLIGVAGIARVFRRSVTHAYSLASTDRKFPPVERRERGARLYFRAAIVAYKNDRHWNRPRREEK
jgi:hypothetical protein